MSASPNAVVSSDQPAAAPARELPILMSGPMVRAILEGRKTQTRRPVKVQPPPWAVGCGTSAFTPPGFLSFRGPHPTEGPSEAFRRVPVLPGDRLWVRETWCPANSDDGPVVLYAADSGRRYLSHESWPVDYNRFPAGPRAWSAWADDVESGAVRAGRPSIHMPRWASRIKLEVTEVRAVRLREITEADAVAEGATERVWMGQDGREARGWSCDWSRVGQLSRWSAAAAGDGKPRPLTEQDECLSTARFAFANLWNQTYKGTLLAWDANPWVWVIGFRRVA